jgi:ATP-dependent helicase YprA (DUF1998 family)
MAPTLNPTEVYEALRDSYLRYLETSFHLKDQSLLEQFRNLLRDKTQPPLVRRPILEISPGFKTNSSVGQLIEQGILSDAFRKFEKDILDRPLYTHQEKALRKAIMSKRNIVIATGTGSGKTEAFLYPIINHLMGEGKKGTLEIPGVRALLLYPMNALANDQIDRLRTIAKVFPDITFGRYTGETDQDYKNALQSYRVFHDGQDPLPNELICRDQMRDTSPHILFTNYAMLEYLLIRPKDSNLFAGGHWRFLVLDEVHTYSGALGVEIAMLLRRLKDRVVQSEQGRLQCFATSATLGGGEKDFPKIASFGSSLFGEPFEPDDIIGVDRVDLPPIGSAWESGSSEMYGALREAVFEAEDVTIERLAEIATRHGVPRPTVEAAVAAAENCQDRERCQSFLHRLMESDTDVHRLRAQLSKERAVELDHVQGMEEHKIIDLVALGAYARKPGDPAPLIPARYHIMARAISGVYAWFDSNSKPQLIARREKRHVHEKHEFTVFELASCNRCGEILLVGEEKGGCLVQPPDVGDDPIAKLSWFQLRQETIGSGVDEDDAIDEEEDPLKVKRTTLSPMSLCRVCGRITDASTFDLDGCDGHRAETIPVFKIENKPRRNVPRQCPSCLNIHASVASRIVTGKQVPVAVLATSLYQRIPPSPKPEDEVLPGGGRKLMMFSDSRQDAAFFAPFMDNTYNKFKQRRYLVEALKNEAASIDLQEWTQRVKKVAQNWGEWDEEWSDARRKRDAGRWVLREWIATDRRLALEGAGSVVFNLRKPERVVSIDILSDTPWNLSLDEQWVLLQVLLDTLRYQGIVSFDDDGSFDGIEHDDVIFSPRNVACYLRGADSNSGKRIYAWQPAPNCSNKRLDYLTRVLLRKGVADDRAKTFALSALTNIWTAVNHPNGPLAKFFERGTHSKYRNETNLLRLKPNWWQVEIAGDMAVYRCDTCATVTAFAINDVCPMSCCSGTVKSYPSKERQRSHYYNLFKSMDPIPLKVSEHTAQLTKKKAFEAQQDFIGGKVNMLSCTTTFELGVDVGDLQVVFMRNMPPSPGNYAQRAGRAGRRADNAAIAVSFAQRRTHDLAYFENWSRMVQGAIRPPSIHLNNLKIIRRHVHAEAIADYFKANPEVFADTLESLFDPSSVRPDELKGYLEKHPEHLKVRLNRIVPRELHTPLGLDNWVWLDGHGLKDEDKRETFVERLAHAAEDVCGDWTALQQAQKNALQQEKGKLADFFLQQLNTLKRRSLLGKLGTYGLMPKYGFPTEVVELKIRTSTKESGEIELDRDMKLALSEFAPGNEVIAGGKVWTSEAIVLPSGDRKLHEFHYWHCDECRFFSAENIVSTGVQTAPEKTCYCSDSIQSKIYLYPEFGFSTAASTGFGNVGDERPGLKSYSEVFFHDDAAESGFVPVTGVPVISYREAKQGWIHVINKNQDSDFYICGSCGFAQREFPDSPAHMKPWTSDQQCSNRRLERRSLGYRYRTDVLELRMPLEPLGKLGLLGPGDSHSLWLSVMYALVNGACHALDIDERDLSGCLYYSKKYHPSVVLFDTAPGGAGFVHEVREHFIDVIKDARKLVDCTSCGDDSSCIACLRTYFNQRDHNRLRRGWAKTYLETLM